MSDLLKPTSVFIYLSPGGGYAATAHEALPAGGDGYESIWEPSAYLICQAVLDSYAGDVPVYADERAHAHVVAQGVFDRRLQLGRPAWAGAWIVG